MTHLVAVAILAYDFVYFYERVLGETFTHSVKRVRANDQTTAIVRWKHR